LPRIQAYRRIYRRFGADPGSRRPSAEALLRRALDLSKAFPSINTVVDAYNLSSIERQVPAAAYDFDRLAGPLVLRFAETGDTFRGIGQESAEAVPAGELVYADREQVICRAWNYRDADDTKVTTDTTNLLVVVDGCDEVGRDDLTAALAALCERIVAFNGGCVQSQVVLPA